MRISPWLLSVGLAAAVGAGACQKRTHESKFEEEKKVDEIQRVSGRESDDTRESKHEFLQVSRERLAELDGKLGEIRTSAKIATGDQRRVLSAKIDELSGIRARVENDLDRLEMDRTDDWGSLKSSINKDLDD